MTHRVLVFPCGSEVALEFAAALQGARHFELYGAGSVSDHGEYAYERFLHLPFVTDDGFPAAMERAVRANGIELVYPAMDCVALRLAETRNQLSCRVVLPDTPVVRTCSSKRSTYAALNGKVPVPFEYRDLDEVAHFPVFLKPDVGYGSRRTCLAQDRASALSALQADPDRMILEYLPGAEYTVDCFSDRKGKLRYAGVRERSRTSNGISMRAALLDGDLGEFMEIASAIVAAIPMRGAWFFQVKRDAQERLAVLEVACRIAGSSAVNRFYGVNLPLLTLFDQLEMDVDVVPQRIPGCSADRALGTRIKHGIRYDNLYVDLDDCLVINGKVNYKLVALIYKARNMGAGVHLLTRYKGDVFAAIREHRLEGLFDSVQQLVEEKKSDYVTPGSIFIDDSHRERSDAITHPSVYAFAPDAIDFLL